MVPRPEGVLKSTATLVMIVFGAILVAAQLLLPAIIDIALDLCLVAMIGVAMALNGPKK